MKATRLFLIPLLAFCSSGLDAQDVVWRVQGVAGQVRRGQELHRLGDVNGDGWEDLIELGEGRNAPSGIYWNEVWVTSGRDGTILSVHPAQASYGFIHQSLAPLGDMDQDGVPDYGVTTYDALSPTPVPTIEVRSGLDHHLLWSATVANATTVFYGDRIAGEVDLDGDGHNDVITTATRMSPGGTVIAYNNSGVELYRIVDPLPNLLIGLDVAPLHGDLDNDGRGDFLVACADTTNSGAVLVVSGRTGSILRVSYGVLPGDALMFVTGCGDIDGDGVPDYAGGGFFGNPVVTAFSGATGQPIHTWRVTGQGGLGWNLIGGFDLDQDGVNDLLAGAPGDWVHALSGRDGSILYSFPSSAASGTSCIGDAVALLAPPPGEQYPLLVYSENCWISPSGGGCCPGVVWALRGSPASVRAFGSSDASANLALPRMGMRDLVGPLARFSLSSAAPASLAVLAFGWSDQAIGGAMLPLPLDPCGLPGITLLTSSDAVLCGLTGTGGASAGYLGMDLRMPLSATGTRLFAQWLWLDPNDPSRHGSTAGHRYLVR